MKIYIGTHDGPPQPDVEGVATALKTLQHEEVTIGGTTITNIEQSERHSLEERKGIDFKVCLANGVTIPLKVKASHVAARRFRKQGHMKPYQIPVVVARQGCERIGALAHQLVLILKSAFALFSRMRNRIIHTERSHKTTGGRIIHSPCPA